MLAMEVQTYLITTNQVLWITNVAVVCQHSIVHNPDALFDVVGQYFRSSVCPLMFLRS